jgi:hypothetical protein
MIGIAFAVWLTIHFFHIPVFGPLPGHVHTTK